MGRRVRDPAGGAGGPGSLSARREGPTFLPSPRLVDASHVPPLPRAKQTEGAGSDEDSVDGVVQRVRAHGVQKRVGESDEEDAQPEREVAEVVASARTSPKGLEAVGTRF